MADNSEIEAEIEKEQALDGSQEKDVDSCSPPQKTISVRFFYTNSYDPHRHSSHPKDDVWQDEEYRSKYDATFREPFDPVVIPVVQSIGTVQDLRYYDIIRERFPQMKMYEEVSLAAYCQEKDGTTESTHRCAPEDLRTEDKLEIHRHALQGELKELRVYFGLHCLLGVAVSGVSGALVLHHQHQHQHHHQHNHDHHYHHYHHHHRESPTMKSDEELDALVNQIAANSKVALEEWPDVLDHMLKRLDWIAHNSFPLPKPPPTLPKPPVSLSRESTVLVQPSEEQDSQSNSQTGAAAATENHDTDTPSQNQPAEPTAPTVDVEATQEPTQSQEVATDVDSTQTTTIPSTQLAGDTMDADADGEANPTSNGNGNGGDSSSDERFLPPALKTALADIVQLLRTSFATAPPHTVQRFAELILKPTRHYHTLPKYLRAVNRVVGVTSGMDKFPLPTSRDGLAVPNAVPLGSGLVYDHDDGATGATLTPIPWASAREYIANTGVGTVGSPLGEDEVAVLIGEAGASGIGISQGELVRREQKAGVAPVPQLEGGAAEDVLQQAAGPPELGAADVGPQPEGRVFGPIAGEATDGGAEAEAGGGDDAKGDADEMDVDEKVEDATTTAADDKGAEKQS
ncbi:hypothetical protein Dda_0695 [Drechslerella dactyloides]|uniref:Uncharacterized protein n=1 Tax=Drechslerella dactyloides TaxID=74499 RepID=A0AAD6NP95_DREDA|nr:hypothetical protein Dda_0695 [Drechslerella dactyloides]